MLHTALLDVFAKIIFFLDSLSRKFKRKAFFFQKFCNIVNVFMLTFDQFKGVVHFKKKKTFADNLLTPMSSKKMSMSFFLQLKRN